VRLAIEVLEQRAAPAVFSVTSLADSNAPGSGTLRAAITASNNATPGPNEIDIRTPGTYALTLSGTATDNSAGELAILNNDVAILNQSGGSVVIDASAVNTRVLDIGPMGPAVNVSITGLTIQHGSAGFGAGILAHEGSTLTLTNDIIQNNNSLFLGGGIVVLRGDLTITNSIIRGNSQTRASSVATGGGGIVVAGIGAAGGTATIANSLITNNSSSATEAGSGGGGLLITGPVDVTITGSEFSGNSAAADGGGLLNTGTGTLSIEACTFNGNQAGGYGGGVSLEGAAGSYLENVTLSGNSAGGGGGLFDTATAIDTVEAATITNNAALGSGGVFSGAKTLSLFDAIVAKNIAAIYPDVHNATAANLVDGGANFIGDNTGAADSFAAGTANANGSYVGTAAAQLDPLLEPLADNGGTATLPDGSHLLTHQDQPNSGNNGVRQRRTTAGGGFDERGFPHPNGQGDLGAFEFQDFDVAVSVGAPAGGVRAGLPVTLPLTVSNLGPNPSRGVTLSATLPAGTAVLGASGSFAVDGNLVTFAVPDLAPGGSTTLTLTVLPAAPGPFTATATVSTHDDPNPANNTAAATFDVLPQPFQAAGFADVTTFVRLVPLGRRRRPQRRLVYLLTNVGGVPLQGPLGLVVAGLRPRRGPRLLNAGGLTAGRQPFVLADIGPANIFEPGQSALVQLVFSRPVNPRGLRVLAGAFA
jgi:uncharacterized repeat protein (TIGR01451 family)